ncbi:hypothetical protein ZIOFF_004229 [Zingiber officinale]|uniref:Peptidase A1 domain-containing protein n=1 Tax=Zingiber officinale TaxID=94328 RepID=A0A8J5I7T5_ZINOF|nr:hypothetical protein ZIOFF_004229 [Zingiber officinale]
MATLSPAAFFSRSSSLFSSSAAAALIHSSVSLKSNPTSSRRLARVMSVRASISPDSPLEVCAKASVTVPNRLGDCPFTQRVLLTLEEKHLPYDIKLVDFAKKPDWFLQVSPEGKVPVIKLDDKWVADSDIIAKSLEEKYPVPSLETPPEKASAKDPTDGTEQALLDELTSFNEYLKENIDISYIQSRFLKFAFMIDAIELQLHGFGLGPFVNGDNISAADLSLGPKLFHMEIALGHYKNWSVPESLNYVTTYMKLIFSKDSFVKTRALPEDVIAGWRPKVFFLLQLWALIDMARCSSLSGLRVELTHVDSNGNFSKFELLQRAALRSSHRVARLTSADGGSGAVVKATDAGSGQVQASVHAGSGEFLMDLAIGTPSLAYSAILDTGSDLIWTQCKPCVRCFLQPSAVFDPSISSTYKKLPCTGELCHALPTSRCAAAFDCKYLYTYGDSSSTQGVLASETFELGSDAKPTAVPGVAFGCGDTNVGNGFSQGAGIVGLGRGPLSLISQLGLGKFSYCLTSLDQSKKSPLLFGSLADLSASEGTVAVQSIPLLKNPQQPSFYYLPLKGITVGGTRLQIPSSAFALQQDGTGGVIIDSGTSITYLEAAAYRQVKRAFLNQVQLRAADGSDVGLDVCFSLPAGASSVTVPKLTFNFDGADLDLPAENYLIADSSTGLLCLTIMGSRGLSIIGNFQQQNLHILYDLKQEILSFVPTQCDKL